MVKLSKEDIKSLMELQTKIDECKQESLAKEISRAANKSIMSFYRYIYREGKIPTVEDLKSIKRGRKAKYKREQVNG